MSDTAKEWRNRQGFKMHGTAATTLILMLLPPLVQAENPWIERAPAAIQRAKDAPSPDSYRTALDVLRRADQWQEAARIADDAGNRFPNESTLAVPRGRAYWRAGRLVEAETIAKSLAPETKDADALALLITIDLARGDTHRLLDLANRLEQVGPTASTHYNAILAARLESDELAKLGERFRAAGRAVKPAEGYPDTVLGESIEGLADFYDHAGVKPTNQLVDTGAAPMPFMALVGLPFVEAYLNGKGPYRLIVDTGGSNGVSLTDDLAKEIGIETLANGSVRGVSGKATAGHAIMSELTIGDIRMRRVLARVFEMPPVLRGVCDGILGTGLFDRARMTLDFQNERLVIEKSSDRAAAGTASRAWIVEDAKIFVPVRVQDQDMLAVVDSGATTCAIAPSALKTLFPDAKLLELGAAGMGVGEGDAPRINLAPSVKFAVFGREMENYSLVGLDMLDAVFGPHLGVQTNVLLGMPLLRQMKSFTVDFAACRVWVEWLTTE